MRRIVGIVVTGLVLAGCSDSPSDLLAPIADVPPDLAAIKFTSEGKPTAPYMMLELRRPQGFNGFVAINGSTLSASERVATSWKARLAQWKRTK